MYNKSPRPKADFYLCHGKCGLWKPGSAFTRSYNKSGKVYAMSCRVCQRAAVGKWLGDYYEKLKSDPIARQAAIDNWPPPPKIQHNIEAYMRWKIERNSFLSRIGVIPKKGPFDYVAHMMRKVKYGQISVEEAIENITTYQERHPNFMSEGRVVIDESAINDLLGR